MKRIPLQISPNPVVEATLELKFESAVPVGTIFGIIYSKFQATYPQTSPLPILNVPEEIRAADPNFRHQVLYKLSNAVYDIQVGNDVIAIHSNKGYVGWNAFYEEISKFFAAIVESKVVKKPLSLTIRYVNFFNIDIFPEIDFELRLFNKNHKSPNLTIRSERLENGLIEILHVSNAANMQIAPNDFRPGSLVDIAVIDNNIDNVFADYPEIANCIHTREKNLFFGLFKNKFIESLSPVYS
jgi:uncharacterized protein (TIGR04255 family)